MNKIKLNKRTFEESIFSDEYYITDLDLWVFSTVAKLPIVLFSSTTLKYLMSSIQWLKLGSRNRVGEKFYFIRSPVDTKNNLPPGYHIIESGYSFSELRSDIFTKAERGDQEFSNNMQSIEDFFTKTTLVTRIRK